jgi:hypothetical protein
MDDDYRGRVKRLREKKYEWSCGRSLHRVEKKRMPVELRFFPAFAKPGDDSKHDLHARTPDARAVCSPRMA